MSCLSVGKVTECVTTSVNETDTLFAVGSILVAIVVLVPTFWIDNKIRDAKKEVSREVLGDIQGIIQNLNKAQLLLFEADRNQDRADIPSKERLILEAVSLWPSFKEEEYRKLSSAYSEAVIGAFYFGLGAISTSIITEQTLPVQRNLLNYYINRAELYLEDTVLHAEKADRDGLVRLACIYGCLNRYEEMIRIIERAITVDENARDDFQEAKRLSLLVRACGIDKRKVERLGKKIGKVIPMTKEEFIQIIQGVDLSVLQGYVQFFAMKKKQSVGEPIYLVTTTPVDKEGERRITGLYGSLLGSTTSKHIPSEAGQTVTMEEFFDEVDKELFIICYKDA